MIEYVSFSSEEDSVQYYVGGHALTVVNKSRSPSPSVPQDEKKEEATGEGFKEAVQKKHKRDKEKSKNK